MGDIRYAFVHIVDGGTLDERLAITKPNRAMLMYMSKLGMKIGQRAR